MTFLKGHPFPVVAYFERVVAVSFGFPESILRPLVDEGLELDVFEGIGFVTVALVWTKALRPAGFPEILGRDFFLAGYRVFTRLADEQGRRLRGLKILQSETDKRSMVWMGNLLTQYGYRLVKTRIEESGIETRVRTERSDGVETLDIAFEERADGVDLPEGSPFKDWRTARRFAGPMPFTFSGLGNGDFVVIEGTRQSWSPRPVHLRHWKVSLFEELPFQGTSPVVANAFMVRDVPYRWERGRIIRKQGDR